MIVIRGVDHRGRPVSVPIWSVPAMMQRARGSRARVAWEAVAIAWSVLRSRAGMYTTVFVALVSFFAFLIGRAGPLGLFLMLFSPVASLLMVFAINAVTSMSSALGRVRDQAVRRALDVGLCPSCDYPLLSLERCDDGCVVCPECRASWAESDPAAQVVIVPREVRSPTRSSG